MRQAKKQPRDRPVSNRVYSDATGNLVELRLRGVDGVQTIPMANFSARITSLIEAETGDLALLIDGCTARGATFSVEVPEAIFSDPARFKHSLWVCLPAPAVIYVGCGGKRLAEAIWQLSIEDWGEKLYIL